MATSDQQNPLDYATPTKRDPKWRWGLIIFACALVGLIILWVIIAG
jgi:hypothetical protein